MLGATASVASAALVYPTSFYAANQNGTSVAADRSIGANALGATDGNFYSLGIKGSIVLDFGRLVGGQGVVTEVTYKPINYDEYANLYTSLDGVTWTLLAKSFNVVAVNGEAVTSTSNFRYLKLVDASTKGRGRDGFDIDSVGFAPVPLPAAGLALAGGLAGLAALRRRRG